MASFNTEFTTTYTVPLVRSARSPRGQSLRAQLVVMKAPENLNIQKLFPVKGSIILGRKESADIFINDSKLSRLHAQIHTDGRHYYIKDLNSTNGTKVNGKFITERRIQPKDIIEIGDLQFEFNYPRVMSRQFQGKPTSFFSKLCKILKFLFLGTIFVFSLSLLYYSATQPLSQKRDPQNYTHVGSASQDADWTMTQADLMVHMAEKAYQSRDYLKARHFWKEAKKLKPFSERHSKLGRAIEEAVVLKAYYMDKIKSEDELEKINAQVAHYLTSAKDYILNKDWNKAIIAFQEALLIQPENIEAKRGIFHVSQWKRMPAKTVTKKKSSNTLKIYNQIQEYLSKAKQFNQKEKYAAALHEYKKALNIAKKHDFNVNDIVEPLTETASTLKSKMGALWKQMGMFVEAQQYKEAEKALNQMLHMNPDFKPAIAKKKEVHVLLRKRAQRLYSQGIIFESMPDIKAAKLKWTQIVEFLSPKEPYYKKAKDKLTRYSSY